MNQSTMQSGGAVLFWSIGDASDVVNLKQAFTAAGFAEHAPDPRNASTVAGEALADVVGSPTTLIRPLKERRGWHVVRETRGTRSNAFDDWFTVDLGSLWRADAVDVGGHRIGYTWHNASLCQGRSQYEIEDLTRERYEALASVARTGQVTSALVDVVDALAGTRLRPSGGLHWMATGPKLDRFAELAQRVESAAKLGTRSAVYIIRHALDVDALRAVRDAITAEVEQAARELRDAVSGGELQARGLRSQGAAAEALAAKVAAYEAILAEPLPALAALAVDAQTTVAMAKLSLSAQRGAA